MRERLLTFTAPCTKQFLRGEYSRPDAPLASVVEMVNSSWQQLNEGIAAKVYDVLKDVSLQDVLMSDLLPALEHAETLASLPVKLNFDKLRITSTLENFPDRTSAGRAEYLSALRHGVVELIKLESKCGGETIQFLPGSVPLLNMARAIMGLADETSSCLSAKVPWLSAARLPRWRLP